MKLLPNESVTFRYRVVIQAESELSAEDLSQEATDFAKGELKG